MGDVNFLFLGDVFVQREKPETAFAPALPYLNKADIAFCNLETVVADAKYVAADDHDTRPRTDEHIFNDYMKAGFNVYNIANNPVGYHGLSCFNRHLDVLDAAGVVYGGGGRNLAEARKPAIIERNGTRVAFVCRTSVGKVNTAATDDRPGVARFFVATEYERWDRIDELPGSPPILHNVPDPKDQAMLEEDIKAARGEADLVIVSWHWGVSPATGGYGELMPYQVDMGRFAIDCGADMVVGHHSHVLQPIEIYKGKPLVYSLANYVHDMHAMRGHELYTMMLLAHSRDGKFDRLSFVPGTLEGSGPPRFFAPAEAPKIVSYLRAISEPRGTRFEVGAEDVQVLLEAGEAAPVERHGRPAPIDALHWQRAGGSI